MQQGLLHIPSPRVGKRTNFEMFMVKKNWDDGQCPKISVKKNVIHHGLKPLRLLFSLIFTCQRNPRDPKCSFIFWWYNQEFTFFT